MCTLIFHRLEYDYVLMFMNMCLQRICIFSVASAIRYACVFSAATNQEGLSPVFHIMSISDLCIKKLKKLFELKWESIFLLFMHI